jgi:hypothetical protein
VSGKKNGSSWGASYCKNKYFLQTTLHSVVKKLAWLGKQTIWTAAELSWTWIPEMPFIQIPLEITHYCVLS